MSDKESETKEVINSSEINPEYATPMLRQFLEIKKHHQGVILFYRMGDFYETFLEDAVITSKDLGITLTSREAGKLGRIPMAGVPAKAADNYISKLLKKGHKVAVCEQMEDPSVAKGLVDRQVVKTITAGTITECDLLESTENNYLAAIVKSSKDNYFGLAYVDISTGEFRVTKSELDQLLSELSRISPSEILASVKKQDIKPFQIVPEEVIDLPEVIVNNYNCTKIGISAFNQDKADEKIKRLFNVKSLEAFGYPDYALGIMAAGAIVEYLEETQKSGMPKFDIIIPYAMSAYVSIDSNTRRNLELTQTVRDNNYKGSLLWAINKTNTNMGARLLRKWLQQPLKDVQNIKMRQQAVGELLESSKKRLELGSFLEKVYDIERLATKISNNTANARDFLSLKDSLKHLPEFGRILNNAKSPFLSVFLNFNEDLSAFNNIVERTIYENPPTGLKEGNLIRLGVNEQLDYLKGLLTGGKDWLADFENREKERTGIKSLKVGYSKTFGYFIEVTHANTNLIPDNYIRKQTLTNAERYITPELKERETEILSAETRTIDLEYQIFSDLREYSKEFVQPMRESAKGLANLDVLLSFANAAAEFNFVQPEIDESYDIIIKEGRHPVIEQILQMGAYVANDLYITGGDFSENEDNCQFMILTGPNMAGKSTFMRQNAIIIILAQIGSYVPAKAARIGIVDKIFTRVGAVDDLSMGQSTFMVEMNETALILNSATQRSFILLDEIGRGTSTYDGVAIALSVAEFIVENIKARTIFATHYHELNVMCSKYPQIANYQVTVSDNDGDIEFLRQVVPGGTNRSYGIQVAKMAGLPNSVISRAESLMNKMQKDYSARIPGKKRNDNIEVNSPQLSLFVE
ncbi:MAG: DNA mismatch repair protein MutS [Candidatus Gastranaerophilales bacterium]|nr:DNA mismatch repair protein MutS [Candidatus Gastranaerophilales bacterium]